MQAMDEVEVFVGYDEGPITFRHVFCDEDPFAGG